MNDVPGAPERFEAQELLSPWVPWPHSHGHHGAPVETHGGQGGPGVHDMREHPGRTLDSLACHEALAWPGTGATSHRWLCLGVRGGGGRKRKRRKESCAQGSYRAVFLGLRGPEKVRRKAVFRFQNHLLLLIESGPQSPAESQQQIEEAANAAAKAALLVARLAAAEAASAAAAAPTV